MTAAPVVPVVLGAFGVEAEAEAEAETATETELDALDVALPLAEVFIAGLLGSVVGVP